MHRVPGTWPRESHHTSVLQFLAPKSRASAQYGGALANDLSKDLAVENKIYHILTLLSDHLEFLCGQNWYYQRRPRTERPGLVSNRSGLWSARPTGRYDAASAGESRRPWLHLQQKPVCIFILGHFDIYVRFLIDISVGRSLAILNLYSIHVVQ